MIVVRLRSCSFEDVETHMWILNFSIFTFINTGEEKFVWRASRQIERCVKLVPACFTNQFKKEQNYNVSVEVLSMNARNSIWGCCIFLFSVFAWSFWCCPPQIPIERNIHIQYTCLLPLFLFAHPVTRGGLRVTYQTPFTKKSLAKIVTTLCRWNQCLYPKQPELWLNLKRW